MNSSSALQATPDTTPAAVPASLVVGTPAYRRAIGALFTGGFATFWLLYWVQPLLPAFSSEYGVSAATGSLLLSAGTIGLAVGLLPASVLSDRFGRKPLMVGALLAAALLTLTLTLAQQWPTLILLRGLIGVALAGLPAIAMAYLGEEIERESAGSAMGTYVAGTVMGGLCGRVFAAALAEWLPWRHNVALVGLIGLLALVAFWRLLPPSRHFQPQRLPFDAAGVAALRHDALALFRDPVLRRLYLLGFLLMGCFVSAYNYLGYRLVAAPYALSAAALGAVSLLYLVGIGGSALAGSLGDRKGRHRALWPMVAIGLLGLLLSLAGPLIAVLIGMAAFTFAFFGAHTLVGGWVGRRAGRSKALASSFYLVFYYTGASVAGTVVGHAWEGSGWPGVVGVLSTCLAIAGGVALTMFRRERLLEEQRNLT